MAQRVTNAQLMQAIVASEQGRDDRLDGIDKHLGELGNAVKENTDALVLYGQSIAVLQESKKAQGATLNRHDSRMGQLEARERGTAIKQAGISATIGGLAGILMNGLSQLLGK